MMTAKHGWWVAAASVLVAGGLYAWILLATDAEEAARRPPASEAAREVVDTFHTVDAKLLAGGLGLGHTSHRIGPGDGLVLAYRKFMPGDAGVIDDEAFEKLTVWLPGAPPTDRTEYDLSSSGGALAVYSLGSSAHLQPEPDAAQRPPWSARHQGWLAKGSPWV